MPKAYNSFVWVIRDKPVDDPTKMAVMSSKRLKPHSGEVHSIGAMVQDKNLKMAKGKKVLFHPGTGQEIDFDGKVYLILASDHILGEDDGS